MNSPSQWLRQVLRRRIVAEGVWVAIGQGLGALGSLVGIRLLTQLLPPAIFGSVTLLVGAGALISTMFCTPIIQAMLRYYPDYAANSTVNALRRATTSRLLNTAAIGVLLLVGAGLAYSRTQGGSPTAALLLGGLVTVDIARSREIAFYNAARRQKPYALWTAVESWARPLLASASVYFYSLTTEAVLGSYMVASIVVFLIITQMAGREGSDTQALSNDAYDNLRNVLLRYALPLMPLAVLDWLSGMGDRYMIGMIIGLKEAGIYAATYGLISRPFMIVGQIVELTLRPHYQMAVAAGDQARTQKVLGAWRILLMTVAGIAVGVVILWHKQMAWLLLGERYRSGGSLMPWIAAGYCLLVLSQFYERQCYAHSKTHYVLVAHVFGGVTSLIISLVAILTWGLFGAALAVPVYFGIQLLISRFLALRIRSEMQMK